MRNIRKLAVGLALLAGTVGAGAGLAVAQTDTTTPPMTVAPSTPPDTEAPADAPRDREDCPDKGQRDGGASDGSGADGNADNTATSARLQTL